MNGVINWLYVFETGPLGLIAVFGYSFLVAVMLPTPGELVLAVPIDLGLPSSLTVAIVIGCSSLGKAIGSVVVLRIGGGITQLGPIAALAERLPSAPSVIDPNGRVVAHIRRYGYVGLALVLAVPLVPNTAIIYGFSVLRINRLRFGLAAFLGTVLRLLAVAGVLGVVRSLVSTPACPVHSRNSQFQFHFQPGRGVFMIR